MSDKDSVSPLLQSVKSGKARAVEALIKKGCDIKTTDKDGKSTIYWAAQKGYMDVLQVRVLIILIIIYLNDRYSTVLQWINCDLYVVNSAVMLGLRIALMSF